MVNAKKNSLGDQLAVMSEDERDAWAFGLLENDLTDEDVIALDILGWKIVEKDPWPDVDGHVYPRWLDRKATGCDCPDWCHDYGPLKPGEVVLFPPVPGRT